MKRVLWSPEGAIDLGGGGASGTGGTANTDPALAKKGLDLEADLPEELPAELA